MKNLVVVESGTDTSTDGVIGDIFRELGNVGTSDPTWNVPEFDRTNRFCVTNCCRGKLLLFVNDRLKERDDGIFSGWV